MTLMEFVLARIAEKEALARMAFGDHNDNEPTWIEPWSGAVYTGDEDLLLTNDSGVSRHIVQWDPAYVLAQCEAQRRIIARLRMSQMRPVQISDYAANAVLRALAMPDADHDDFLPGWIP